jgi:branched-chain amino acid transport system permease protein
VQAGATASARTRLTATWNRLGWKGRAASTIALMLSMAALPLIVSPDATLLFIPDPALVLFGVGLYLLFLIGLEWWGYAALIAVLVFFVQHLNATQLDTVFLVSVSVLLALGLNIVVGYAGLLDLGFVAFFAIGAYTWGALNSPFFGLQVPYLVALPLAIALAATAGVLLGIPVLRLRGDYLAIVTLGFGEIIGRLSNNLTPLTGGAVGIYGIGAPAFLDFITNRPLEQLIYLCVVCCIAVAFGSSRMHNSRTGRAWEAIREDEDVAAAMGVNTIYYKLLAFGIGAAIGGFGGTIFAAKVSAISPPNFVLDLSIRVVAIIIIGGMGSIPGVIIGALVLVGLPEILRSIQEWRLVSYGALLVAMVILRPEGILPERRRAIELHSQDAEAPEPIGPLTGET